MGVDYVCSYDSPLGEILLAARGGGLCGLWFVGQRYFGRGLAAECEERRDLPVFEDVRRWLDEYFAGVVPTFTPQLNLGGTAFQRAVWGALLRIPYGAVTTYGEIAAELGRERAKDEGADGAGGIAGDASHDFARTSARAVGGAVGHNPVSIIVPCHRVVGAGGKLTGYAGGLDRKRALLQLEGIELEEAQARG